MSSLWGRRKKIFQVMGTTEGHEVKAWGVLRGWLQGSKEGIEDKNEDEARPGQIIRSIKLMPGSLALLQHVQRF